MRRGKADEPLTGGYHPIPTRTVRYPPASDTRTPQADRALALPAKPARQRPTDRARDLDRPAMYPGGTWHPPPVDPRHHRASPSDHADACDSADVSEFRHRILMQRPASPFVISSPVRRYVAGRWYPTLGWARSPIRRPFSMGTVMRWIARRMSCSAACKFRRAIAQMAASPLPERGRRQRGRCQLGCLAAAAKSSSKVLVVCGSSIIGVCPTPGSSSRRAPGTAR